MPRVYLCTYGELMATKKNRLAPSVNSLHPVKDASKLVMLMSGVNVNDLYHDENDGENVSLRTIIRLGPLIFFIHDLEEVIWTQRWIEDHRFLLEGTMGERLIRYMGYRPVEFGLVVVLITILYGIICYFATRPVKAGMSMNLYVSTLLILFVNVFTHLGQSLVAGMYTPGVVTALLIVFPYTVYAFRKLKANRMLTRTTWKTSPFMSVGMVMIIFGLMVSVRLCFG